MITVVPGDPRDPAATALLKQSHALMQSLFPPEDNYFLDIEALCAPEISFFVAHEDGEVLGTGALAEKGNYGEVKSMFTAPHARGRGVALQILETLEQQARLLGLDLMRLETGNLLEGAVNLYERAGFVRCGIFGDYRPNTSSIYMEKRL